MQNLVNPTSLSQTSQAQPSNILQNILTSAITSSLNELQGHRNYVPGYKQEPYIYTEQDKQHTNILTSHDIIWHCAVTICNMILQSKWYCDMADITARCQCSPYKQTILTSVTWLPRIWSWGVFLGEVVTLWVLNKLYLLFISIWFKKQQMENHQEQRVCNDSGPHKSHIWDFQVFFAHHRVTPHKDTLELGRPC